MVTFTISPEEMTRRKAMLDVMAPFYEDDKGSVPYGARRENGAKNLNCDALVKIQRESLNAVPPDQSKIQPAPQK